MKMLFVTYQRPFIFIQNHPNPIFSEPMQMLELAIWRLQYTMRRKRYDNYLKIIPLVYSRKCFCYES